MHAAAGATLVKGHPLTSTSVFSALAPYGWDSAWADAFTPYDAEGLLPGRVVRVDRGQCDVVTADGVVRADTAFVTPRDPMRVVCTSDWVAVEPAGNPRRTAFVRSTSSKRSEGQILAANVDHAVVAVSLAVELDLGRIERFLALAWESGAAHTAAWPLSTPEHGAPGGRDDSVAQRCVGGTGSKEAEQPIAYGMVFLLARAADFEAVDGAEVGAVTTDLLQEASGEYGSRPVLVGEEAQEVRLGVVVPSCVRTQTGLSRMTSLTTLPRGSRCRLVDLETLYGME